MRVSRYVPAMLLAGLSFAIALAPGEASALGAPVRLAGNHLVEDLVVDQGVVYSMKGAERVLRTDPVSGATSQVYRYTGNGFLEAFGIGGGRFAVGYADLVANRKGLRTRVAVSDSPGSAMRVLASGTAGWESDAVLCGASANLRGVDASGNVLFSSGRASKSFLRCGRRPKSRASLFVSPPSADPRFPAPLRRVYSAKENATFLGGKIDGPWIVSSRFFGADSLMNWQTGFRTGLDDQGNFGGFQLPGNNAVVAVRQPGKSYASLPATISADPTAFDSGASLGSITWDTSFLFCGPRLFAVRSGLSGKSAWIRELANPFSGVATSIDVVGPTSSDIQSAACDSNWLAFTSGKGVYGDPAFGIDLR